MRLFHRILFLLTTFCLAAQATTPQKLILKNQFGEQSNFWVMGTYLPLPGTTLNLLVGSTATTPVDGGSGTCANICGKGSIDIARDTGVWYINTGTLSTPVWSSTGTTTNAAVIAATLTAFSAGAGTITSSDSILTALQKAQGNESLLFNGTFSPTSETVSGAGAISTTKMETVLANGTGGTYAATLAAPSSQDGQLKILKMSTATHTVTLAMTNISVSGVYTASGTTTLTFTNTGDSAVFIAVGTKWVYLGGTAVAT